jgi:CheY-like chemotaxis protein
MSINLNERQTMQTNSEFNILLIDDEPAVRTSFERFLQGEGYNVTTASDARAGMQLLKQQKVHLIITDIMMPEMDGLELLMELKKQHKEIPVIVFSGGMKQQPISFLPMAKKFGASRIFDKPVNFDAMRQAIHELLAGTSGS